MTPIRPQLPIKQPKGPLVRARSQAKLKGLQHTITNTKDYKRYQALQRTKDQEQV